MQKMTINEIKAQLVGKTFGLYGFNDFDNAFVDLGYSPLYDKFNVTDWFDGQYLDLDNPVAYEAGDELPDILVDLALASPEDEKLFKVAQEEYDDGKEWQAEECLRKVNVVIKDVEEF